MAEAEAPKTWILTGSPENFEATRGRGFTIIGMKEGRRRTAEQIEPDDRIVFYLTRVARFAGSVRVTGPMFEDREKLQGQLRTVSEHDAGVLVERLRAGGGVRA